MSGPRIAAVRLVCADVERTAAFYVAAFGFRRDARAHAKAPRSLALGRQRIELVPASVPAGGTAPSNSTAFQHCAIVVADAAAAMDRLRGTSGWRAISRDGPEKLPASSGGVTAFKFRDPEGHPLEFLQFPAGAVPPAWQAGGEGPCSGIDHSAITVADTDRAITFYRGLGFSVMSRRINRGSEQERLDDVAGAVVEVTGLSPPGGAPPHLELLCYREPGTLHEVAPVGDARATRLVLRTPAAPSPLTCLLPDEARPVVLPDDEAGVRACRDPCGHILVVGDLQMP